MNLYNEALGDIRVKKGPSCVFLRDSSDKETKYRVRPNYRTVRLGFSKLLGTLICG